VFTKTGYTVIEDKVREVQLYEQPKNTAAVTLLSNAARAYGRVGNCGVC
jgi:hypothetical protein